MSCVKKKTQINTFTRPILLISIPDPFFFLYYWPYIFLSSPINTYFFYFLVRCGKYQGSLKKSTYFTISNTIGVTSGRYVHF